MTSTFFQRILLLVLLAGCMTGLHAQEYKYEIGGMAGGAFYMGDVNKNAFFKGLNPAFGAVFRYNPNFRWALKTNLMWGQVSGTSFLAWSGDYAGIHTIHNHSNNEIQ